MRHEMLTQRALFCHRANTKRGTLSQRFVTHVVPPLGSLRGAKLKVKMGHGIFQGCTQDGGSGGVWC